MPVCEEPRLRLSRLPRLTLRGRVVVLVVFGLGTGVWSVFFPLVVFDDSMSARDGTFVFLAGVLREFDLLRARS